jgi:hypothetical protein
MVRDYPQTRDSKNAKNSNNRNWRLDNNRAKLNPAAGQSDEWGPPQLMWSVIPISDKPVTMPRVPLQEKIDKSVPAAGSHANCRRLPLISAMVDLLVYL